MPSASDKQSFLKAVCSQIRFRSVHKKIANELSDHIEDQTNQYIMLGMDEDTAACKAVEQMGDPVLVGKELDKTHRPKIEWSILVLGTVLVILGCLVQYLLTQASPQIFGSFSYVVLYMTVGLAVFVAVYFFGSTLLMRYSTLLYFFLLAAVVFYFASSSFMINGGKPHIYYVALLFIPVFASIVHSLRKNGYWGIVLAGVMYAIPALLCLAAPNSIAFMILSLTSLAVLTVAIIRGTFNVSKKGALTLVYGTTLLVCISIIVVMALNSGYYAARFFARARLLLDPNGAGYAFAQIREVIANAQPFGTQALPLPGETIPVINSQMSRFLLSNDFSLTYLIYRFGTVPAAALGLLFLALIVRMFSAVTKLKNDRAYLLALSVWLALSVQIVLYSLSNLGVIAPVSVVLPFLSFGALGFITNLALLGLLLSIYRRKDLETEADEVKPHFISAADGKVTLDFSFFSAKNK